MLAIVLVQGRSEITGWHAPLCLHPSGSHTCERPGEKAALWMSARVQTVFCGPLLQVTLGVTIRGAASTFSFHLRAPSVINRGKLLPFAFVAPEVVKGTQTQHRVSIPSADTGAEDTSWCRCCPEDVLPQGLPHHPPRTPCVSVGHLSTVHVVSSLKDDQFSFVMSRALMLTEDYDPRLCGPLSKSRTEQLRWVNQTWSLSSKSS